MKTKRLLLIALALTLPWPARRPKPGPPTTLPPGLIAWWQAESNCLDTAGTNHGTPVGAA